MRCWIANLLCFFIGFVLSPIELIANYLVHPHWRGYFHRLLISLLLSIDPKEECSWCGFRIRRSRWILLSSNTFVTQVSAGMEEVPYIQEAFTEEEAVLFKSISTWERTRECVLSQQWDQAEVSARETYLLAKKWLAMQPYRRFRFSFVWFSVHAVAEGSGVLIRVFDWLRHQGASPRLDRSLHYDWLVCLAAASGVDLSTLNTFRRQVRQEIQSEVEGRNQ
jgi:hypothetical protein